MTAPLPDNALTEEEIHALIDAMEHGDWCDICGGPQWVNARGEHECMALLAVVASIKAAARAEVEAERDQWRATAQHSDSEYKRLRDEYGPRYAKWESELAAAPKDDELRGRLRALVKDWNIYASGIETTQVAGVRFGKLRDVTRILSAALAGGDSDAV